MSSVLIEFTQLGLLIWETNSDFFSSEAGARVIFLPRARTVLYSLQSPCIHCLLLRSQGNSASSMAKQMNKQNKTHRYREQTGGCQGGRDVGRDGLGVWD